MSAKMYRVSIINHGQYLKKLYLMATLLLSAVAVLHPALLQGQDSIPFEMCTATVLNRTVQLGANGTFEIQNIPVPLGAFRARIVCDAPGGVVRGQTKFVFGIPNGFTDFGPINFTEVEPIPVTLEITAPATVLTPQANGVQLVTTGVLPDGTPIDLTLADTGTFYLSSNPRFATVSPNGFVNAVSSGNVLVTATHEGVIATISLTVELTDDMDSDGIPDDFEDMNTINSGGANLARLPGTTVTSSSFFPNFPSDQAIDGNIQTSWFTAIGDAANLRTAPFIEVTLPQDGSVAQVRLLGNRQNPDGFDFLAGIFQAFDLEDNEIFNSGEVPLPGPTRDIAVPIDLDGVRRVRFTSTDDESSEPGLAEFQLISRPGGQGLDKNNPDDAALDFDQDGLSNLEEFNLGTSVFLNDTDGDGLDDAREVEIGSSPVIPDTDRDRLIDVGEVSPTLDTDGDGLINILDPDSDNDGLPDGVEVALRLDPLRVDSDFDGIPDGAEDGDGDNLPNQEEVSENTNATNPDTDNDELLDGEEVVPGEDGFITDVLRRDTDGDGMWDGYESRFGLDPTDPNNAALDPDEDGLTNLEEFQLRTDPNNSDTVAPAVSQVEPADSTADFPVNGVVIVRFTEALQTESVVTGTVRVFQDGEVPGAVMVSGDGLSITFTPDEQLTELSEHMVRVQNVRDIAGNRMTELFESTFTTAMFVDTVSPTILVTSAFNGQTNVPVNAPFSVQFSEVMDPATLIPDNLTVRDNFLGQNISGMIQVDSGNRTASFVPDVPFAIGRSHTITLGTAITDAAGNALTGSRSFSFTTSFVEDIIRPRLRGSSPVSGSDSAPVNALVVLDFNESINSVSVNNAIQITVNGESVPGSIAISDGSRRVTFTSEAALSPNTVHTITVTTDITDLAGNPLENPGSFIFGTTDTGDVVQPGVTLVSPANGSVNIPNNAVAEVRFSERINPLTVNASTFFIDNGVTGLPVSGSVNASPNGLTASFTPTEELTSLTNYRVRIFSGIQDLSGQALSASSVPSTFTVGDGTDSTAPSVQLISPADGTEQMPVNGRVVVQFSEAVSIQSVSNQSFSISENGTPVVGTISFNSTLTTLTFVPSQLLPSGSPFTVDIDGVTDQAGNAGAPFSSSFSTSFENLAGATGVSTNVSSSSTSFGADRVLDGNLNTSWFTAPGDAFNRGSNPFFEVILPGDALVTELRMFGNRQSPNGFDFFSGTFQMFDANDTVVFDSGNVELPAPDRDLALMTGDVPGVRRVRFEATADESNNPGFAELEVLGQFSDADLRGVGDSFPPMVVSVSPVNGTTDVSIDTTVTLTFTGLVDPTSVNGSSIPITIDGFSGQVAGTYTVSGSVVTFTPDNAFPGNVRVRVRVNANTVRDLAGNGSNAFSSTFDTGAGGDTTAPEVISVIPADGATEIGPNSPVILTFSESLNATTVNGNTFVLFFNGVRQFPFVSRSADNQTVTLSTTLPANSVITVAVTADVEDLSGNHLSDFVSEFQTAPSFDTTRPSVVVQRPGNGASGVSVNSGVVLFINESMVESTLLNSFFVSQDGGLVSGTTTVLGSGQGIEFMPDEPLQNNAFVQVFLTSGAQDQSGNALFDYQGSFRTELDPGQSGPVLVDHRPSNGATGVPVNTVVDVGYNEALDSATVNSVTVKLLRNNNLNDPIDSSVGLVGGDRIIRIIPDAVLESNILYGVNVSNVTDLDGDTVVNFSRIFTTGDSADAVNPTVVSVTPPDGTVDVGINASIRVQLSEPINPLTVDEATILVTDGNAAVVACTINFSNNDQNVSIVPHSPLAANGEYSVTVDGVQDLAGNAVIPQTTQFTTGPDADLKDPAVVRTTPVANSTAVPINPVISVEFDKVIDPTTVNNNSFLVQDNTTGKPLSGNRMLSSDGRTVSFIPDTVLGVNRSHSVFVGNRGILDLTGNMVRVGSFSFTTGLEEITTGPQIVGINPVDGITAVPTNVAVLIQFDRPVSNQSIRNVTLTNNDVEVDVERVLTDGDRRLSLRPKTALDPLQNYTLLIEEVSDLSGNVLSPSASSTFTTGIGIDVFGPTVVLVSPANGTINVPTNVIAEVRFSERVNPLTVNTSTFFIDNGVTGLPVSGSVTVGADGMSATFTPATELTSLTNYRVRVFGGIQDLIGQGLSGSSVPSAFTVGDGTDSTAPSVQLISPADGTEQMPVNGRVVVQFSEAVSIQSVSNQSFSISENGTPVVGTISFNSTLTTLTFVPSQLLPSGSPFTVDIDGVTDQAGNAGAPFSSSFSTSFENLAGATGVSTNVSSSSTSFGADRVLDGNLNTSWFTAPGDAFNRGSNPFFEVILPGDALVTELRMFGNRQSPNGFDFFSGTFQMFDANDTVVFDSGNVELPAPDRDLALMTGDVPGVRRVRFEATADESNNPGFAELEVLGQFSDADLRGVGDSFPPMVVSVSPVNGTTDVSIDTTVTLTFTGLVDPTSVNGSSIPITIDGFSGQVAGTYTVSGSVVTFTPDNAFPGNVRVRVRVNANTVRDLAGNGSNAFSSTFDTGAGGDTTAPEVISVIPADGATEIGPNSPVILTFSESLNATTVNGNTFVLFFNGVRQFPFVSRSADNQTVTLSTTLPANSVITVAVTADVEDLSGNHLSDFVSEFQTAPSFDTTRPSVVVQRPGNGASGVSVNSGVVLFINESMVESTLLNSFFVSQDGGLVSGTTTVLGSGQGIEFMPDEPLQNNAFVQVFLTSGAQDQSGNALFDYQGSFRTELDPGQSGPVLVDHRPSNGATGVPVNTVVDVGYNEALDSATVNSVTVKLLRNNNLNDPIDSSVGLVGGDRIIRIIPDAVLESNILYGVNVSNVTDLDGDTVVNFSRIFTTGDSADAVNPTVVSVTPPDGTVDVGINASIRVQLSEPINPLTVDEATILVTDGNAAVVACTINFSNNDQNVSIVPHSPLAANGEYSVTVDGVQDLAGNAVIPQTTQFTTGPDADLREPSLIRTNPTHATTDVPVNVVISLEFTERLDPVTVTSESFLVRDNVTSQAVAGSLSFSPDGRTVNFVPDTALVMDRSHSVFVGNRGILDITGNLLRIGSFSFTTGSEEDTTAPQVVGISPSDGSVDVPINVIVFIDFDEPINILSLSQITLTQGQTELETNISVGNGNRRIVLTPFSALDGVDTYEVFIDGVEDLSGNTIATPEISSFMTNSTIDVIQPVVANVTPENNAPNISLDVVAQVTFSERVNFLTVNDGTLFLERTSGGIATVPAMLSIAADGLSATITPNEALLPSSTYRIRTLNSITDLAGNGLGGNTVPTNFTTASE